VIPAVTGHGALSEAATPWTMSPWRPQYPEGFSRITTPRNDESAGLMRKRTLAVGALLLVVWSVFAAWQYRRYLHERDLLRESLHQQSHSLMNALVGGIRSHRRLGRFFTMQLQGMLDELVRSEDVLAAAVLSVDREVVLSAGDRAALKMSDAVQPGDRWEPDAFRLVKRFHVAPPDASTPGRGGWGRGPGWGRRRSSEEDPLAAGGDFLGILALDRSRHDRLCRGAAWAHGLAALAGALVVMFLALAWWASVRAVTARGRAAVLEAEARHLRELSQAAAGLAHETRNPLGLIRGWTQRLAQSPLGAEERGGHVRSIVEECDRVTARINQFLAFARPHEPDPQPVDLDQLVDELATLLQPDLEAKNLSLEREIPAAVRQVRADRELLRQALFNLIQNAVQFSPEGQAVSISAVPAAGGSCRIEVRDRGPGVDDENIPALFTPYFTTRHDGTGLGLAIVHRLATLHGWTADYRRREGGGSVFCLEGVHV